MIFLASLVLVIPVWFLCVAIGLCFLLSSRLRHLATHLIVSATLGAVGAETIALVAFFGLAFLGVHGPEQSQQDILIEGFFIGFVVGAVLGVGLGIVLAPKLNGLLRVSSQSD